MEGRMHIVGLAISSCALAGLLVAQPSLRITSPPDGTTFHPGESLTVTVEASPTEAPFVAILVTGPDPLPYGRQDSEARPYRFTLQIPEHAPPKRYSLTAMGSLAAPARLVFSNSIDVVIERADSPVSITVYPVIADFTMDQKRYLQVMGLYADDTTADLTQSSRIEYVSSAPWVATVQAQGIVTPVAPGTGNITVTYGDLKLDVPVRVREIR